MEGDCRGQTWVDQNVNYEPHIALTMATNNERMHYLEDAVLLYGRASERMKRTILIFANK